MNDVITIGDALIAFEPQSKGPLKFVHTFERKVGGAELNFAIGCTRLGLQTGWISRLGNDEFGKYIHTFVRGEGIDTNEVKLVDGYPTSVYFKEVLEDGNGRSFYYRSNSPTNTLTEETLNLDYIKQARILHITGVFLSINKEKNLPLIKKAVQIAKENGVLISLDPNIRLRLWTKEEAKQALLELLPFTDILLTGEEEAEMVFHTTQPNEIIEKARSFGISTIAIKQGDKGAIGYHMNEYIEAPSVKAKKVVDTVGAGDGFNSGFIYGLLQGWSLDRIVTFATTIGAMVVSVSGDNEGLPYLDDVLIQLGEKQFIER